MAPPTRRRTAQRGSEENEPQQPQMEGDFFEFSSSMWYALILSGVTLFWMVCFHPDLIPYASLGPIGNFLIYFKENHTKALIAGSVSYVSTAHGDTYFSFVAKIVKQCLVEKDVGIFRKLQITNSRGGSKWAQRGC